MPNKQAKTKKVRRVSATGPIVSGFVLLLVAAVSTWLLPKYSVYICIAEVPVYAVLCAASLLAYTPRRGAVADAEAVSPYLGDIMTDVMSNMSLPAAICSEGGIVIWHNPAFGTLAEDLGVRGRLRGGQFSAVLPVDFADIVKDSGAGVRTASEGRVERIENYRFRVNGRLFFMVMVHDITESEKLRERLTDEHTLVAHIQIDNLGELLQYEQGEYRDAGRDVDAILKAWAESVGAILREYDTSKYMMFFHEKYLSEFTARKFDVLDRVRDIKVGAGMIPVTVSIGISTVGETLSDCENGSLEALNTALQRGGDQVVLTTEAGTDFYGGRTKTMQRRTKVRSRVIANELSARIAKAGNVIVMGHLYPDFDSIGSCVGAARIAKRLGADVHIVADVNDQNIAPCIEHVRKLPEYEAMFVDEATALDMIRSDTLVIVCDVNSASHISAPSVALSAPELVIIDHHIKTPDAPENAVLTYIEPAASSASELISDMIEQMYQSNGVMAAEADVMYAGILLDTKQLSRSTTARTFAAAMYLQSCGANPETAADFFRAGLDDFTSEARFESNVTIYRGQIAIACSSEAGDAKDRIAAAKAADKLLTVKGVTAAFAAVRIDDTVHISARSSGSINVQLILERLGGGGHFDVAGAQLKNSPLDTALKTLKDAIDDYFEKNLPGNAK